MKTPLILALLLALIGTNLLWFIRECDADRLENSGQAKWQIEKAEWQHAAKPVFDARGITYKDPTPANLRTALDATRALLPHEGYKAKESWQQSHGSQITIEPVLKKQEYRKGAPETETGFTVRKAIIPTINQE